MTIAAGIAGTLGLAFLPTFASASAVVEGTVDTAVVLHVGAQEISAYAFQKNLDRYCQLVFQRSGVAPNAAELQEWWRLFVAQQLVINQAEQEGFFARPEVVDMVARMERYMLTQPEGPLYTQLYRGAEVSDEELPSLYAKTALLRDLTMVRFSDAHAAEDSLGRDYAALPVEARRARIEALPPGENRDVFSGFAVWPFGPFSDCADALEKLAPGQLLENEATPDGVVFACLRKTQANPLPPLAENRDAFRSGVEHARHIQIRRSRRAELLRRAKFTPNDSVIERLARQLQAGPISNSLIPSSALVGLANEPMYWYELDGARRSVSVQQFANEFNGHLVRRLQPDRRGLRALGADMVTDVFDEREARARGVDRAPKFMEDRQNFLRYQALDRYEKEKLLPEIAITTAAMADYYAAHRSTYARPVKVLVRKAVFTDRAAAAAFIARARNGDLTATELGGLPALPVTRENVFPELQYLVEGVLMARPGAVFGPAERNGEVVVFLRGDTIDASVPPLSEVVGDVRAQLERGALDQRELVLARTLAPAVKIVSQIDAARFGLPRDFAAP